MTKRRGFQSDLATILAGAGATVTVLNGPEGATPAKIVANGSERQLAVEKFFTPDLELPSEALLTSISVPFLQDGELFKTYRTAIRPINSHALTNAAFRVKMQKEPLQVASAQLVFGALESRESGGPIRASGTEAAIVGKAPDEATLAAAVAALVAEPWFPRTGSSASSRSATFTRCFTPCKTSLMGIWMHRCSASLRAPSAR